MPILHMPTLAHIHYGIPQQEYEQDDMVFWLSYYSSSADDGYVCMKSNYIFLCVNRVAVVAVDANAVNLVSSEGYATRARPPERIERDVLLAINFWFNLLQDVGMVSWIVSVKLNIAN